jgi:hypothetical protein
MDPFIMGRGLTILNKELMLSISTILSINAGAFGVNDKKEFLKMPFQGN